MKITAIDPIVLRIPFEDGGSGTGMTPQRWAHLDIVPAVTYPQPSVTKVGGVSEFLRIAEIAERHGRTLMPHSPYFGPGYFATLQLTAALDRFGLFEQLYVWPEAHLFDEMSLPHGGEVAIPDGPGLGSDLSGAVIEKYQVV